MSSEYPCVYFEKDGKCRKFSDENTTNRRGGITVKRIAIAFLATIAALTLSSCGNIDIGNMDIIDTVYTYDWAIIRMPNGEIVEGEVESWQDYVDGDQIQVKIEGKTYLVHANNICLIAKENR